MQKVSTITPPYEVRTIIDNVPDNDTKDDNSKVFQKDVSNTLLNKCLNRLKGVNGTLCFNFYGKNDRKKTHIININIPLNDKRQIKAIEDAIDQTSSNKVINEGIIIIEEDKEKHYIKYLSAKISVKNFEMIPKIAYRIIDKMMKLIFENASDKA